MKWYGHVMRKEEVHMVKKAEVLRTDIKGKKPKTRWKDTCQRNVKTMGQRAGEESDTGFPLSQKSLSHLGKVEKFMLAK